MRTRTLLLSGLAVLLISGGWLSAAQAQSNVFQQLWVERNQIYADNGYCFKTERAISYFGNAGCRYEYEGAVPLSRADRARINRIQAAEREYGCR